MKRNEICPNCRSVYEIAGSIDLDAPSIQVLECPVCAQKKWIPSGLLPYRWKVSKIIKAEQVTTTPQLIEHPKNNAPVWSNFDMPNYFKQAFDTLYTATASLGIWSLLALFLIYKIRKGK